MDIGYPVEVGDELEVVTVDVRKAVVVVLVKDKVVVTVKLGIRLEAETVLELKLETCIDEVETEIVLAVDTTEEEVLQIPKEA